MSPPALAGGRGTGVVWTIASDSTTSRSCSPTSWNQRTSLPNASRWPKSSAAGSTRTCDHSTRWRPLSDGIRRISLTLSPAAPA